jgi:2-keto-3-deoxy-L-rhamnonate aldolase RhmA
MMKNNALEKLRAGDLSLGVGLRQARTAETALALETAGFDWLFLDMEHNAMSVETASAICVAVLARQIAAIVRVPERQFWLATRMLDGGAEGIVMPHISTAEEAREVVRELRYPPIGQRSIGSMQPHVAFADVPVGELTVQLERKILIAVMLESAEAVANAEEIAAVDGIDVLMIGANDLCLDLGVPGDVMNPQVVAAFTTVAEACAKFGRYAGLGGVRRVEDISKYIELGYRFLFASDDVRLLVTAGRERTTSLRVAAAHLSA